MRARLHHFTEALLPCILPHCATVVEESKETDEGNNAVPQGGIQRYMEAFPDGGYFMGKNFVFDERVTVAGGSQEVVGTCCLCAAPFDAYEPRSRCSHCRMLVLVCPACASQVG